MMKMLKRVFMSVLFCLFFICSYSQFSYAKISYSDIEKLDKNEKSYSKKLAIFYQIKKNIEKQALQKDSTYSLVLLKIAKYEQFLNNNYSIAFAYTTEAIEYNKKIHSRSLTFLANYNFALYYYNQFVYSKALNYCDSTILHCGTYNTTGNFEVNAHWIKASIYLSIGDYQKTVDESNFGIALSSYKKDTTDYVYFLNRKAIALFYENDLHQSLKNAQVAIACNKKDFFELNISYKTIAKVYENKMLLDSALFFYTEGKNNSLILNNSYLLAYDYNDLGNFYLNATKQYNKAKECYYQTIKYSDKITDTKDAAIKAMAFTNLCETSLKQHNLNDAERFIQYAFFNAGIKTESILNTISSNQFNTIIDKDLVTYLLFNKTSLLLQKFKTTKQKIYLQSCLTSALLADSVITIIRHEQISEKSKLYWRDKTRDLYPNAIEASYLANNSNLAFYFMEKSRAVLLNDKLNELGAAACLPAAETKKQEAYQIKIGELEQELSVLNDTSKHFQVIQSQLIDAKNDFEQFIKTLENNYPAYYQNKYADDVPALNQLQQYLAKNKQSFVHYFMGDTVTYILSITPDNTRFIKLTQQDFNETQLTDFITLCSNKEALNHNYPAFAGLSNSIYKTIFQPLQLPKGRVIICGDKYVIPFEALCTGNAGNNFLLNDYSFSYVYAARFLLNHMNNKPASGNFVGFAPVSFAKYLGVQDLKTAADALNASSQYYNSNKLFTYQNATRSNFFKYACSYSVINIFSHAHADTTENEPVLYMCDSVIHLSELQLLNNPATKLVLLSACQTNVGKTATGEGIYSLARGFATAGIASVSATLWIADEQSIYSISQKFNEYLSEGMNKDEALQKAKIYFMQKNNSSEKMLPYYWANMILIGNADAIQLTAKHSNYGWWIAGFLLICTTIFLYFNHTKNKR